MPTLEWLKEITKDIDIDLYLPVLIIDLYNKILVKKGFTLEQVGGVRFNKS